MINLDEIKAVIDKKGNEHFHKCKELYLQVTGKRFNSSCSCSMNRCKQVLREYYNKHKIDD